MSAPAPCALPSSRVLANHHFIKAGVGGRGELGGRLGPQSHARCSAWPHPFLHTQRAHTRAHTHTLTRVCLLPGAAGLRLSHPSPNHLQCCCWVPTRGDISPPPQIHLLYGPGRSSQAPTAQDPPRPALPGSARALGPTPCQALSPLPALCTLASSPNPSALPPAPVPTALGCPQAPSARR